MRTPFNNSLNRQQLIEKAKFSKRESRYIEYKEKMDIALVQDWCEIIKDIAAIANSGGGIIVFGIKNDNSLSDFNSNIIFTLDPAVVSDKISKYTDIVFENFEIIEIERDSKKLAAFLIGEAKIPIVFSKPGAYTVDDKQKIAFSKGTIYFRHSAKSEPCNSNDLKEVIDRNVELIRKSWLGNIRKVVSAPLNSKVEVLPPSITPSNNLTAIPIRITKDSDAPVYKLEDPNLTHLYRQKDIINIINKELPADKKINSYHILCIRKEFAINESKPDFYFKPIFGSPQYSDLFVEWLKDQYKKDNCFFEQIKKKFISHL